MNKEKLLKLIKEFKSMQEKNSMGCSENWYVFQYAMLKTFTMEEIENMSDTEIDNLYRLHDAVSDGLY